MFAYHGNNLDSCFHPYGPVSGHILVSNWVTKHLRSGRPEVGTESHASRDVTYRVETLIHSPQKNGETVLRYGVYNFRDKEMTLDRSGVDGLDYYRPETSPHIYADIWTAMDVFMEIGRTNGLVKWLESQTGTPHRLMGCWIRRFDERYFQTGGVMEVQWTAEEGVTYDVANGFEQISFLLLLE